MNVVRYFQEHEAAARAVAAAETLGLGITLRNQWVADSVAESERRVEWVLTLTGHPGEEPGSDHNDRSVVITLGDTGTAAQPAVAAAGHRGGGRHRR